MLSHELDDLFQTTRLKVHEGNFVLLGLSSEDGVRMMSELDSQRRTTLPFMSFQDGFECTFLFREEDWKAAGIFVLEKRVETGFRLVTLDRELTWDVVGYLARVTRILAEANISVGVLSSFSRDHLLINETDLDLALLVLNDAITGAGDGGNNVN